MHKTLSIMHTQKTSFKGKDEESERN